MHPEEGGEASRPGKLRFSIIVTRLSHIVNGLRSWRNNRQRMSKDMTIRTSSKSPSIWLGRTSFTTPYFVHEFKIDDSDDEPSSAAVMSSEMNLALEFRRWEG